MYHHQPVLCGREPAGWCVWETVAADSARAVVGIFRLAGPGEAEYHLRLRGLDAARRYMVTFDNTVQAVDMSGLALMQQGLAIRLEKPLSSELLLVAEAR